MSDFASIDGGALSSARRKPRILKQLFDSEYVKPMENSRVIQDNDPCKFAVYNDALKRYELELQKKGDRIKQDFHEANKQISAKNDQEQKEMEIRKEKLKKYNQIIREQMEQNVSYLRISYIFDNFC